jgi:hypothetical protein
MFKEKKWSNRIQLIIITLMFLAPLVGAKLYYSYLTRDGRTAFNTVNNGEFYTPPQDLANVLFNRSNGPELNFNEFDKRWYVVVVANGNCSIVCEKSLDKIARVRAMNGKNIGRIVSVLAHTGLSEARSNDLLKKYGVKGISTDNNEDFTAWLTPFYKARKKEKFEADRIYLIDPLKILMMSYPADVAPKGLFKDLKRLLKTSQIG